MTRRTTSSNHAHVVLRGRTSLRGTPAGRMSFMPLTALSLSAMFFLSGGFGDFAEPLLDVVLDDLVEFVRDVVAAQGHRLLAVDENGGRRRFARPGQADADVGMLAFAGAV